MLRFEEALEIVLSQAAPLPPVVLPLEEILGLVLAEEVIAGEEVPPFTNSAMDGFALRAEDLAAASEGTPIRLAVIDEIPAGRAASVAVRPATAIRIMTGAPMPEGADTVLPVEQSEPDGSRGAILVRRPLRRGVHVRLAGEDMKKGSVVLPAGRALRAAELGVLAAVGATRVPVHPRPRVAVMTTGDELVDAGVRPGPGQIRDANLHTMRAQLLEIGTIPVPFARIPDRPESVREALQEALALCDVVVTNGGISVGDYDFIKDVLGSIGVELRFWKVAQKPGSPLAFWTSGRKLVFSLPGNPVSAMVCLEEFVRPALRKMMGHLRLHRPERSAIFDESYRKGTAPERLHFLRVRAEEREGNLHARTTRPQGSGILTSMSEANALAIVDEGRIEVLPGESIRLHLTDEPEDH
jgi:molybdopterin molybdotransferase